MIPWPPKVKLVLGVLVAGLLAAGQYWLAEDSSIKWLPPILAMLVFAEGFVAAWFIYINKVTVPPAAMAKLAAAAKKITDLTAKMGGMSVLLLAGWLAVMPTLACKGASFPSLAKIEQVVLNDLAVCGTSQVCVTQMETDVATLIAQGALGPNVGADSVTLVKDALTILIDAGLIPADVLPKAKATLAIEKIKLAGDQ